MDRSAPNGGTPRLLFTTLLFASALLGCATTQPGPAHLAIELQLPGQTRGLTWYEVRGCRITIEARGSLFIQLPFLLNALIDRHNLITR